MSDTPAAVGTGVRLAYAAFTRVAMAQASRPRPCPARTYELPLLLRLRAKGVSACQTVPELTGGDRCRRESK